MAQRTDTFLSYSRPMTAGLLDGTRTGEILRSLREARAMTQTEFAAFVGVKKRETVSRWERGQHLGPRARKLLKKALTAEEWIKLTE
jgi:transcriptional regulator with XRE-family HTH domain